ARREREARAATELADARQAAKEAEAEAGRAELATKDLEARLEREATRAREAEAQLRDARRELAIGARAQATKGRALSTADVEALRGAVEQARQLAADLHRIAGTTRPVRRRTEPAPEVDQNTPRPVPPVAALPARRAAETNGSRPRAALQPPLGLIA